MNDTLIVFFAILAIFCQGFVAATVILFIASKISGKARAAIAPYSSAFRPIAMPLAFAIALVTMLGSLYMSEVKHFPPCHLCWVQRSFLYPQTLITLALLLKPTWNWLRYLGATLAIICIPVSIYHYLLEWNPTWTSSACDPDNPCGIVWVREFGYVSLPFMALSSACALIVLYYMSRPSNISVGAKSNG